MYVGVGDDNSLHERAIRLTRGSIVTLCHLGIGEERLIASRRLAAISQNPNVNRETSTKGPPP